MILPGSRLLLLVGALVALSVVTSAASVAVLGLTALCVIAAALDAIAGRKSIEDLNGSLPPVLRFSRDREGSISILLRNPSLKAREVRVGLALPSSINGVSDLRLRLPEGTEFSRSEILCTPERRGRFRIDRIHFETQSPLKLWNVRRSQKLDSEIRVYPNLSEERKKLSALFLNRGDYGVHARRIIGQGREFEKLREYVSGDDFDQIYWKATARRGRPITKLYQIERTQEVYVVIDYSRLSGRQSGGESNLEFFIRSALILGLIAQQQGDLFGLLTFADRVGNFIRAGNGKAHYNVCRDAIYTLEPRLTTPDYQELFSFIRLRLRRRALLVVLTDLSDPVLAEQFGRAVDLISRHHLVLVNMMRPPLALPLFSVPDAHHTDDLYRKLSGHLLWENLRELENNLHLHGVNLTQLSEAEFSGKIVTQYLNVKKRQVL